jgi:uncharacterized protein YoxC
MRLKKHIIASDTQEKFDELQKEYDYVNDVVEEAKQIYSLVEQTKQKIKEIFPDSNILGNVNRYIADVYLGEETWMSYERAKMKLDKINKELTPLKDERTVEFWQNSASTLKNKMKKIILADYQLTIEDAEIQYKYEEIDTAIQEIKDRLQSLVDKVNSGSVYFDRYVRDHSKSTVKVLDEAIIYWEQLKNRYRERNVNKLVNEKY